jgi:uncharacterized protein (TIGR03546 family)
MGLLFKNLFQLIKLLNSETGQNQIAAGVAAGFVLGMTPGLALHSVIVFICLFVFRIQMGMAFLSTFFFAFVAWLLDPVFHIVGTAVLQAGPLQGLWAFLYNLPIVPLTRFNNSIVMGSGVITLLLSPAVFYLSRKLVIRYRETVMAWLKGTRFWGAVKASGFYKWYYYYDKIHG